MGYLGGSRWLSGPSCLLQPRMVFLWDFQWVLMGFLWYVYDISMGFLWDVWGKSMIFLWDFFVVPILILCYIYDIFRWFLPSPSWAILVALGGSLGHVICYSLICYSYMISTGFLWDFYGMSTLLVYTPVRCVCKHSSKQIIRTHQVSIWDIHRNKKNSKKQEQEQNTNVRSSTTRKNISGFAL